MFGASSVSTALCVHETQFLLMNWIPKVTWSRPRSGALRSHGLLKGRQRLYDGPIISHVTKLL